MFDTVNSESAQAGPIVTSPQSADSERQHAALASQIEALMRESRLLDALSLGRKQWGDDVRQWPGVPGQLSAIRLADRLGGHQLANALVYRLRRSTADHPEVVYAATKQRLGLQPFARLWLKIRDQELASEDPLLQSRWLGLKGRILAGMRDFDRSFELIDEAIAKAPDDPNAHLSRAHACSSNDDLSEAIRACHNAVDVAPLDGPAVQMLTHFLLQSNEIDEAFDILTKAVKATQDGSLRMQLASMLSERELYGDAIALTKNIERYFPLADPMRQGRPKRDSIYSSIAALRADLAYHSGDYPGTATWATRANVPFYDSIAESIRSNHETGRRVQLKVPFVLQKHVTCAPATLTMLSGFWNHQVDHDDVVNEICYDGTAPVRIRGWADKNNMVTREFRVTFEATQQLIDAGIPFGLATMDPGMGHIQVICGYDSRREVLLVQDPGAWHVIEALKTNLIDNYRAFGPRGLVLIPKEQASKLDHLQLPDSDQFDRQYEIAIALQEHDRDTAAAIVEEMRTRDPDHWMTQWCELDLAIYDSNGPVQLDKVGKLREAFPDDDVLWLQENRLLSMLDRSDVVVERLREAISTNRAANHARMHLIGMLDDVDADERETLLRRMLREAPTSSAGLSAEATRLWRDQRYEDALELYRLAAMSSELDEGYAQDYLIAAKRLNREPEVLDLLRRRFEKHGNSSGSPGMTYAWALDAALRSEEAAKVVRETMSRRPEDAELLCNAAHVLGRLETPAVGTQLLESASITLPSQERWQATAILAGYDGRPADALTAYREIEKLQPLNPSLIDQIASLEVELHGFDAALKYLVGLVEKYPHCRSLLASTAQMMFAAAKYQDGIEYVDRMLESYYSDAWAWRLRASLERQCSWHEQAFEDAEQALACDHSAASYTARGEAYAKLDRLHMASEDFRCALQQDCDYTPAIASWMQICRDQQERVEALEFMHEQLLAQHTSGEGLEAYYSHASGNLEQNHLSDQLVGFCTARPDLYITHVLLANHYRHFRRFEEAESVLLAMQDQFGRLPVYWRELGDLYCAMENDDRAMEAYENGLEIGPHDSNLAPRLAELYRKAKRRDDAIRILRRALHGSPSDPGLMVALAETIEDQQEALSLVRRAAMWAPQSAAAWDLLLKKCQDRGCEKDAVDAARELVAARPCDVHSHLRLAEMLHREDQCEESLSVIADAMQLDRRLSDVHSLFAYRLFERKYYDEALKACSPPEVDPQDAHELNLLGAKVLYYSGDKDTACIRLREALHRDPTDVENWVRLADWCQEANNLRWYDEASTALAERAPHLSVSHCYYAQTLIRQNRRERAKEHLQYAIEIDPKCEFGLRYWMQLMFEDRQLNAAEKFLDRHAEKIAPQPMAIGRLLIAGVTNDAEAFVTTLRDLPEDGEEFSQLDVAIAACDALDFEEHSEIATALARAIRKKNPNKALGYIWARFFCQPAFLDSTIKDFHRLRHSDARNTIAAILLAGLKDLSQSPQPELRQIAVKETNRILRRLGSQVLKNSSLWSHALWTLIEQEQYRRAVALAKKFKSVKDRDVDDLAAAMIAAMYHRDLKMVPRLLADADRLGPAKMTENGRLLRAMYLVHVGTDDELKSAIRMVDKNQLDGPFLRIATLIGVGAQCIESKNEAKLVQQWKVDFFRECEDTDPIDQSIYQLLRSRVAAAAGDRRKARKLRRSKYKRHAHAS